MARTDSDNIIGIFAVWACLLSIKVIAPAYDNPALNITFIFTLIPITLLALAFVGEELLTVFKSLRRG